MDIKLLIYNLLDSIHDKMSVRQSFKDDTDVCVSVDESYIKTCVLSAYKWWFMLWLVMSRISDVVYKQERTGPGTDSCEI